VDNNKFKDNNGNLENIREQKKTVLVVEDEKNISDILVYNLKKEGYNTLEAYDGEEAIEIATKQKPDLILLDVMLPKIDGFTVCKKLRHTLNVPIIILSARADEIDKIVGLEMGADDYITKPYSIRELMARVKANLRKGEVPVAGVEEKEEPENKDNIIQVGTISINTDKFEIRVKGKKIDTTKTEFGVLYYLAKNLGKKVTREQLLRDVWKYDYLGEKESRNVDVAIARIREKIGDTVPPTIVVTKRAVGYYLSTGQKED